MKKLKAVLTIILSFVIMIISVLFVYASNITVKLNNDIIDFEVDPIIINDRVIVPMRSIFEKLGYEVNWNSNSQTIVANKKDIEIKLSIGSLIAEVNNEKYNLDSPPLIFEGVTMVPIRFISIVSGANVVWDSENKVVNISNKYNFDINKILECVVQVNTDTAQGSGFLIGDGILVTNRHVLKNAKEISFIFNDYSIYNDEIKIIGFDEVSDIVIIKMKNLNKPYLDIGNSDNINIGDKVIAIGSPLGNLNIITQGSVIGKLPGLIVSTAKIQQGSSGGVLLNNKGEAVGITFSYDTGKNYFSIPINDIKNININKEFTLEQYSSFENIISPPLRFNTNLDGSLYWEPVYGADGYYIYISDKLNGEYNQIKSPSTGEYLWSWGYPKGFGIKSSEKFNVYVKIASVKDGIISDLTSPIEVSKR